MKRTDYLLAACLAGSVTLLAQLGQANTLERPAPAGPADAAGSLGSGPGSAAQAAVSSPVQAANSTAQLPPGSPVQPVPSPIAPAATDPTVQPTATPSAVNAAAVGSASAAEAVPYFKETGNTYTYEGKQIHERQYQGVLSFNHSYESFRQLNYARAEAELRRALALFPELTAARTDLGLILSRLGKDEEAVAQLKQAILQDRRSGGALTVLAGVYQATGRLDDAVSIYQELVARFPGDPNTAKARVLLKDIQTEVNRENEIRKTLKPEEAERNYFPFVSYDYILKWKPEKFPLKVFLPSEAEARRDPTYKPQYGRFLRAAFDSWSEKTNHSVSFIFVAKSSDADIDCLWTDDITKVSRPSERGEAKVAWDPASGLRHVQIVVLTHGTDGEENVPDSLIQIACLHEIGHSLGIMGHSPNSQDIMFCSVPTKDAPRELSARDCDTLSHLYDPNVKISYFFHEGKSSPNDKVVLNNQGVEFAQAHNFAAARDKFEAAVKLDPKYDPARRNLGAILNNLANQLMSTGKYDEAEACFKQAIEIQRDDPDLKRKSFTFHNYACLLRSMKRLPEAANMEAQFKAMVPKDAVTSLNKK